jgi:TolB-like protein/Flp pilus assembly protein TadD
MGQVWEAVDERLRRTVALKVLPVELAEDGGRLQRLRREAEALAALNHPNIVTIHSLEEADGVRFLTMELIEGKRLSQLIPENGMPVRRILDSAIRLADALAAAHERGVIHRDLKPHNIMVTADGRVKILDFGLAKIQAAAMADEDGRLSTDWQTDTARIVGTAPYMSPEQLAGGQVDERSDLFSFGIVLYEMATGRRPFPSDSSAGLISSILRDSPQNADVVRTDLPHHLARIIRLCLEKDPERRYQAAKDVRNELGDLRTELGETGSDPQPAMTDGVRRRTGISWRLAAGLMVLVLALASYAVWRVADQGEDTVPEAAVSAQSARRMIVVLPLDNHGPAEDGYFADGMTDEIASRLASIPGIGVIARTSAMHYRNRQPTLAQLGKDLGVQYVLEGSVRWEHGANGWGRVRITPVLSRVQDGIQLWSHRYDRVLTDIFDVQAEIAEEVIRELEVAIAKPSLETLRVRPTGNLEAYQAYLKGLEHKRYPGYSLAHLELAVQMFERAVSLDPGLAQAWAELGAVHSTLYFNEDLAPHTPAVRAAAGYYYYRAEEDYDRALEEFAVALESLPGNVEVLGGIGLIRRRQGQWQESLTVLESALELDPRNAELAIIIAETLYAMRRYGSAIPFFDQAVALAPDQASFWGAKIDNTLEATGSIEAAREVLESVPATDDPQLLGFAAKLDLYARDYPAAVGRLDSGALAALPPYERAELRLMAAIAHDRLGQVDLARERLETSRRELVQETERLPEDVFLQSRLGRVVALLGEKNEALERADRAVQRYSHDTYTGPQFKEALAMVYTALGDNDRAVSLLDELLSVPYHRAIGTVQLALDPAWDSLRADPAFLEMLERRSE